MISTFKCGQEAEPIEEQTRNDGSIINAFSGRGVRSHASRYTSVSTSLCAVMCPLRVCVCLLIHASASTQLSIRETVLAYFQMCARVCERRRNRETKTQEGEKQDGFSFLP